MTAARGIDPGRVDVFLRWRDGRVEAVTVALTRPNLTDCFRGMPAQQAVERLPLLYSICGKAQALAARLALRAAQGEATEFADDVVRAEARRERLMRLALDWPPALGLPQQPALLAEGVRQIASAGFDEWVSAQLRPHIDVLLDAAGGQRAGLEPVFAAGLGFARAEPLAPGRGRAHVATARGELVHELTLAGDAVADYAIHAPTDRHFAADGPLARCLQELVAATPDGLRRAATLAVLAFDPCVPWGISVDG